MKNFRFTDASGTWVNIYNVPGGYYNMANEDSPGFVIDYTALGEQATEEELDIIMESVEQAEIDDNGYLV